MKISSTLAFKNLGWVGIFVHWCLARVGQILSKRFSFLLYISLSFFLFLHSGGRGFSWTFFCPFALLIGGSRLHASPTVHSGYMGGKKETQQTLHYVLPQVLTSLNNLTSFHFSESSFACLLCYVQGFIYLYEVNPGKNTAISFWLEPELWNYFLWKSIMKWETVGTGTNILWVADHDDLE